MALYIPKIMSFSSPLYVKPVATGAVAAALDKYVLLQPDMKKSLYFGGSVAVGSAVATLAAPIVPNLVPNLSSAIDGKTVSGRVVEVALSTGWTKRLAVIAASGFIGEYISDYLVGNPLSYFK